MIDWLLDIVRISDGTDLYFCFHSCGYFSHSLLQLISYFHIGTLSKLSSNGEIDDRSAYWPNAPDG